MGLVAAPAVRAAPAVVAVVAYSLVMAGSVVAVDFPRPVALAEMEASVAVVAPAELLPVELVVSPEVVQVVQVLLLVALE